MKCFKLALICRVINHAAQAGAECGLFETLSEITHLDWPDGNICCSKLLNMLSINLLFPGKKVHMFILLFFREYSLFCALHLFSLSELTLQFDNSAIVYILFVYFCHVTVILEIERQREIQTGEDPFTTYSDFLGLGCNKHCRYVSLVNSDGRCRGPLQRHWFATFIKCSVFNSSF